MTVASSMAASSKAGAACERPMLTTRSLRLQTRIYASQIIRCNFSLPKTRPHKKNDRHEAPHEAVVQRLHRAMRAAGCFAMLWPDWPGRGQGKQGRVTVEGVLGHAELNGQQGKVVERRGDKVRVKLERSGEVVLLSKKHLVDKDGKPWRDERAANRGTMMTPHCGRRLKICDAGRPSSRPRPIGWLGDHIDAPVQPVGIVSHIDEENLPGSGVPRTP